MGNLALGCYTHTLDSNMYMNLLSVNVRQCRVLDLPSSRREVYWEIKLKHKMTILRMASAFSLAPLYNVLPLYVRACVHTQWHLQCNSENGVQVESCELRCCSSLRGRCCFPALVDHPTHSSLRCTEHSDAHEAVVRNRRTWSGGGASGGAVGASAARKDQAHLPPFGSVAARAVSDATTTVCVAVATVLLFFSSAYVVNLGDHVVVFNTKDVVFTGKKWDQKLYRRHTG